MSSIFKKIYLSWYYYFYWLMQLLSNLWKLLFPRSCFSCWRFGSYLCQKCIQWFHYDNRCYVCNNKNDWVLRHQKCNWYADWTIVLFEYRDAIRKFLLSGKYFWYYRFYSELWQIACHRMIDSWIDLILWDKVCITYVPIHFTKQIWKRWYNQSFEIAKNVAKYTWIDCYCMFKKNTKTQQQSLLKRADRLKNLDWTFLLIKDANLFTDILIVDDVISTWSTLDSLSLILKDSNPSIRIWYIVVARSPQ